MERLHVSHAMIGHRKQTIRIDTGPEAVTSGSETGKMASKGRPYRARLRKLAFRPNLRQQHLLGSRPVLAIARKLIRSRLRRYRYGVISSAVLSSGHGSGAPSASTVASEVAKSSNVKGLEQNLRLQWLGGFIPLP